MTVFPLPVMVIVPMVVFQVPENGLVPPLPPVQELMQSCNTSLGALGVRPAAPEAAPTWATPVVPVVPDKTRVSSPVPLPEICCHGATEVGDPTLKTAWSVLLLLKLIVIRAAV